MPSASMMEMPKVSDVTDSKAMRVPSGDQLGFLAPVEVILVTPVPSLFIT